MEEERPAKGKVKEVILNILENKETKELIWITKLHTRLNQKDIALPLPYLRKILGEMEKENRITIRKVGTMKLLIKGDSGEKKK